MSTTTPEHRSGFACLVGRPNAGKSTLTNALVGQKVAITSGRPQTTRHTIRGIVHRPDAQLVLVDTPGLHRPRTLLGERLNDLVRETLTEVDVIAFCLPADQKIGPGDRFIANELAELMRGRRGTPVVAVVTKADLVDRGTLAAHLLAVDRLGEVTLALAGLGDPERTMANATVYLEAAGHVVVAWMWLEQLVAVGDRDGDFYDGKRAAARYFFRWELPKVGPMLDLLASGDTTTLEMRDAWF